jgi:hypothetical protein
LPLLLVAAAGTGCDGDHVQPADAELQELLKDGDLAALSRQALGSDVMTKPGGGVGRGGSSGVGGSNGSGGATCDPTGSGGRFPPPTGSGGTTSFDAGGGVPDGGAPGSGSGGALGPGPGPMEGSDGGPVPTGGRIGSGTGGSRPFPDGGVPPPPPCIPKPHPMGQWSFDDCNMERTDLSDMSPTFHTAFRSVGVSCTTGIENQGLAFDDRSDLVYVPDQPDFTFEEGVTAAAWVNPRNLNGVQSILRKREEGTSSFLLAANGKRFQFVVLLASGQAASASAPAKKDVWTHVAGTYDGQAVRLYLNGEEAAVTYVRGRVANGPGPVLMGNDANRRRLEGKLDNAFFDTRALSAGEILALTCVHQPATLVVDPTPGPTVPAGTPVTYDIQITNHDPPACGPQSYFFDAFGAFDFTVSPLFAEIPEVAAGETRHFPVVVASSDEAEPGQTPVPFTVFPGFPSNQGPLFGEMIYDVAAGGCRVITSRELMIRSTSVVDDPIRTSPGDRAADPRAGAWTFARLMREMAPAPADAPAMVEEMLGTWLSDQTVNGFVIPARPAMQDLVLSGFPRLPDGSLDIDHAPVRLLAIVNRIDIRNLAQQNAGEGRFVFGVLSGGFPLEFTLIVEYKLPATTPEDVQAWADRWHALGELPLGSEEYNAALQAVTDLFVSRGARPGAPNGSALSQLRSNEIALSFEWQLREFVLSPATGRLTPATIKLTPDLSFNFTETLASFINQNEAAILAEQHDVPLSFQGAPFLGGSVVNNLGPWFAGGIVNNEARHKFSLNTCNGCHSASETGTFFLQISPRFQGQESFLSGFLTGITVFDPGSGQQRDLNDLRRRNQDLRLMVCPDAPPPGGGTGGTGGGTGGRMGTGGTGGPIGRGGTGGAAGPIGRGGFGGSTGSASSTGALTPASRTSFLSKGINRVH